MPASPPRPPPRSACAAKSSCPPCSPAKRAKLRALGAEVVVTGAVYADALAACLRASSKPARLLTHAYDQPEVVAGAGTLATRSKSRAACPIRCW
jgi:threonine dehydratase